jgi:drug/metabolite transporter (DMT)-like permease
VKGPGQPRGTPTQQMVAGLVAGGLGCVLIGYGGLFLSHNNSSGRVPLSIFDLLFGVGALVAAGVVTVRNKQP